MTVEREDNIKLQQEKEYKEKHKYCSELLQSGEFLKAETIAIELYEMAQRNWNKSQICHSEVILGVVARLLGQFEKCKRHFIEAIRLADELKEPKIYSFVYKEVAKYYFSKGNWDQALKHGYWALEYAEKYTNKATEFDIIHTIAGIYFESGNDLKAKEYFSKASDIAYKGNNPTHILLITQNQGYVYMLSKEYEKAIESYERGLKKQKELDMPLKSMANGLLGMADAYLELGDVEKAGAYGEEALEAALEAASERGENQELLDVYDFMINYYEAKENYKEALKFSKKYYELDKKLFKQNNTTKLEEMVARYEMEKKEKESIIYELKALRAQINPHFIFNALSAIQAFIWKADNKVAVDYLGRFARLIRQILDYSEEHFITLDNEIDFITNYLIIEQMRFKDILTYEINIDPQIDTSFLNMPPMVLQPYIENAIKHGIGDLEEMHITINIGFSDNVEKTLTCTIEDNGIGRERAGKIKKERDQALDYKYESKGTKVTNNLLHALTAKLGLKINVKISDLVDAHNQAAGTHVELTLPYKTLKDLEKHTT